MRRIAYSRATGRSRCVTTGRSRTSNSPMVKKTVSIILGLAQDPSFHPTNLCVHEEKQEENPSIVLSAVINLELADEYN